MIDAINYAKSSEININELNDAQCVLDSLIIQKGYITDVTQALSNAIAKQGITDLKSALSDADRIGVKGEIYDGAKSLLVILIEAGNILILMNNINTKTNIIIDAAKKLEEAMNRDYQDVIEFDHLSAAIQNAEKVGVRIEKIEEAKNLLNTLIKNRFNF